MNKPTSFATSLAESRNQPPAEATATVGPVSRRQMFIGAGAVGVVAAAAAVLPLVQSPTAPQAVAAVPPLANEGGYQLTDHVKRYYQTARV